MAKTASDTGLAGTTRVSDLLRARPGAVDLAAIAADATPGFDDDKADAEAVAPLLGERLARLQEQLFAEGRTGGTRSVLLVLQGMDTSGKGGVIKHVVGHVDPAGVRITSFKRPTDEELRHHFLWRIRKRLPDPGLLGVFDRSHYEDVVAVRVRRLVDEPTWRARYDEVNAFEEELVAGGTRVVKCFLHISREEQKERLLARLEDPTKHWKFNPADLDDRARWDDFIAAYGDALSRCNAEYAPWHVVPADRKWYRNWAISLLLVEQLEEMALRWPEPAFDVAEMIGRVRAAP
jgi:PPK2 family polyphosphate:nucleotide phosphotransferase